MEEKIKDIYNCKKLEGYDSLVIWHNQVIEKPISELTVADVARCIRQNLFLDAAYEMLLVYLLYNPYEGDLYEGELMDKACEMSQDFVNSHKKIILEIIEKANNFCKTHEWECNEDRDEYLEAVNKLSKMIE